MAKDAPRKVPALRFKGFTEDWKERRLGEVFEIQSGFTGDSRLSNGEFKVSRIETIANGVIDSRKIGFSNSAPNKKYKLDVGDILYSNINSINHIGKVAEYVEDIDLYHGINLLRLTPIDDDSSFLFYELNTEEKRVWAKSHANQAVSQASINQTELKKQGLNIPSVEEQNLISKFLIQLDSLISLHQRRIAELEKVKIAYLAKLFPGKDQHKPVVRFHEFSGNWNLAQVSSLYKKVNEKNDLSFNSNQIISVANMYFKDDLSQSSDGYMRTYNVFRVGDIAFEGHKSKKFTFGRFVENTIGDGIVSHVFDVFRPINDYDLSYWKYAIHNEKNMRPVLAKSTTKATMMNNLVAKDFLKQHLRVPDLAEQKKIGKLLMEIDTTLDLHRSKESQLQSLKSSLLTKLFV